MRSAGEKAVRGQGVHKDGVRSSYVFIMELEYKIGRFKKNIKK